MKKSHRDQLLKLASWLDRRAAGIRAFVKSRTPKRGPRVEVAKP